MKKRNIALCVIFSIITFGIYGIYWFIKINNDANELANPPKRTSGGVAFLLTLITCGIYGIYWAYKMGKQLDSALERRQDAGKERRGTLSDPQRGGTRLCGMDSDAEYHQFHDP